LGSSASLREWPWVPDTLNELQPCLQSELPTSFVDNANELKHYGDPFTGDELPWLVIVQKLEQKPNEHYLFVVTPGTFDTPTRQYRLAMFSDGSANRYRRR